jgi:hypothetical protein
MTILLYLLSLLLLAQQPARPEFGTISGQLRDIKGAPAAGVRVAATPAQSNVIGSGAVLLSNISQTDSEGRYRLEDVAPGRYLIVAGLLASPTYYPGVTTPDQGRVVTIAAGQAVTGLDYTLAPALNGAVADQGASPLTLAIRNGIIRVDDGSKLPGQLPASVRVGVDGDFSRVRVSPTASNFSLTFSPGSHAITLGPLPIGYYLKSMTSGNVDLTRAPLVSPPSQPQIEIVLTKARPAGVPRGVRVSGLVTNADFPLGSDLSLPLRNVSIQGTAPSYIDQIVAYVRADRKTGVFQIEGVPPGRYTLEDSLTPGDYPHGIIAFDVAENDVPDLVLRLGKPEAPALPSTSSTLTSIYGTVEARGETVPEFEIGFTPTRAGATHAVAVISGKFSIPLPTGEYRVTIAGLPGGFSVESVNAGPLDLAEPFLVTAKGIADRFTGAPILTQSNGASAASAAITVRLKASSSGK